MASQTLTVRRASAADLEIILRHRQEMFLEMGFPVDPAAQDASRAFFAQALTENRYHGWFLADPAGNVVAGGGIILLEYQPGPLQPGLHRPFVVNVWTDLAYRRQGLARQLLDLMIAWTRQQGFAALHLHASEAGRPLYSKLGFVPTNEMRLKL